MHGKVHIILFSYAYYHQCTCHLIMMLSLVTNSLTNKFIHSKSKPLICYLSECCEIYFKFLSQVLLNFLKFTSPQSTHIFPSSTLFKVCSMKNLNRCEQGQSPACSGHCESHANGSFNWQVFFPKCFISVALSPWMHFSPKHLSYFPNSIFDHIVCRKLMWYVSLPAGGAPHMGPPPPPPRPASPMFVAVPPKTQRLLHSEAYLKQVNIS